jgi:predicted translin family RNA/ssDNA-binding protein
MGASLFTSLRSTVASFDSKREQLIRLSRDCLQHSKTAIYACHRGERRAAASSIASARKALNTIDKLVKTMPKLANVGAMAEAEEEYAEACCLFGVLFNRGFPAPEKLGIDPEHYLGGLCDCAGELVRRSINAAIQGDASTALRLRSVVQQIHDELAAFDWRNTNLRRKFDSIKYGLEKLDDMALRLKLQGTKKRVS